MTPCKPYRQATLLLRGGQGLSTSTLDYRHLSRASFSYPIGPWLPNGKAPLHHMAVKFKYMGMYLVHTPLHMPLHKVCHCINEWRGIALVLRKDALPRVLAYLHGGKVRLPGTLPQIRHGHLVILRKDAPKGCLCLRLSSSPT